MKRKKYTIKDLPESERPYDKFLKYGGESLSDAELLAVIIRTGSNGRKAIDLADDVLSSNEGNLLNLYSLTFDELQQIDGIGQIKAIQLKCLTEISRRLSNAFYKKSIMYNNPSSIAAYYMENLRHLDKEIFKAVMFDTKYHMLLDKTLSEGVVNASIISPREVFILALQCKAVTIVVLHNHPSGDPTPSAEDIDITNNLRLCGEFLNIPLSDHIIIGNGEYFSFKEAGLLDRRSDEQ